MIDIGVVVHGMVVEEVAFDQPGAWFLSCGHGHRVFATTKMLESGPVACKECVTDAAVRAKSAQIMQQALDDSAAGSLF